MRLVRILWLIVLTCSSLAPWIVKFRLGINGARHNLWHFAAFFVTALVFSKPPFHGDGVSSQMFRSLAAPMVAISLEALEAACYHIGFEWKDVCVDCAGIAVGFASVAAWQMFATQAGSPACAKPRGPTKLKSPP